MSCQLSHHCSRAWAIRQLTVEYAIRRRISRYRHGFSHARSATMMDDTLIIVSLEPMKMVTKLKRKSLRAPGKVETPQCARKETGSLKSRPSARLCVMCSHFLTETVTQTPTWTATSTRQTTTEKQITRDSDRQGTQNRQGNTHRTRDKHTLCIVI